MFIAWDRMVRNAEGAADGGAPADTPAPAAPDAPAAPSTLLTEDPPALSDPAALPPGEDTEGAKPGEEAKGEEKAPEPIDPASYEVTLPEGIDRDDPLVEAFLAGAAKGGMEQDSVQAVLDSLAPKLAERLAEPANMWRDLNEQWRGEIKRMPDIGGANEAKTVATVRSAIDTLCTGYRLSDGTEVSAQQERQALVDALNLTGAGNNPALVRFLYRAASRLVEPGVADPGPVTGGAVPQSGNAAARMYPSSADAAGV